MDQLRTLVPTMTAEDEKKIKVVCKLYDTDSFEEVLSKMVEELVYFYDAE